MQLTLVRKSAGNVAQHDTDADGLALALVRGCADSTTQRTAQALGNILTFLTDREQEFARYQKSAMARADELAELRGAITDACATVQRLTRLIQDALVHVQAESQALPEDAAP